MSGNAYRTDRQMKFAAPLACLLLPLIALFFAATGPPFPRPVHTLIASVVIAVTHAIATSFAGTMGYGGTIAPWLAGWGTPIQTLRRRTTAGTCCTSRALHTTTVSSAHCRTG